jgi:hypothetical protein
MTRGNGRGPDTRDRHIRSAGQSHQENQVTNRQGPDPCAGHHLVPRAGTRPAEQDAIRKQTASSFIANRVVSGL